MAVVTVATSSRAWYEGSTTNYWSAKAAFAVSTSLYVVTQDTPGSPKIRVFKSTSQSSPSFSQMDSANAPSVSNGTYPFSAFYDGSQYIHVVAFTAANTLEHFRFDTSTDLWTTDYGVASLVASTLRNVRVVVRSDGDVIVGFTSSADDADLMYSRYEGSWTSNVSVVNVTTTEASTFVDMVIDTTSRVHFLYIDAFSDDMTHRTLSTANTLGSEFDIDSSVGSTDVAHFSGTFMSLYSDAGIVKFLVAYEDSDGTLDERAVGTDAASNDATYDAVGTVESTTTLLGDRSVISTARYDGINYVAWWDDANSGTIYYAKELTSATWTRFIFGTVASNFINLVPITGVGLLFVYQDGTSIKAGFPPELIAPSVATASAAVLAPTAKLTVAPSKPDTGAAIPSPAATIRTSPTVSAVTASVTNTAVSLKITTSVATISGVVINTTTTINVSVPVSGISADVLSHLIALVASATVAGVTGEVLDTDVSLSSTGITITPSVADVAGLVIGPGIVIISSPSVAVIAGAILDPGIKLISAPSQASASGSVGSATVAILSSPSLIEALASAENPDIRFRIVPGVAGTTGVALDPSVSTGGGPEIILVPTISAAVAANGTTVNLVSKMPLAHADVDFRPAKARVRTTPSLISAGASLYAPKVVLVARPSVSGVLGDVHAPADIIPDTIIHVDLIEVQITVLTPQTPGSVIASASLIVTTPVGLVALHTPTGTLSVNPVSGDIEFSESSGDLVVAGPTAVVVLTGGE